MNLFQILAITFLGLLLVLMLVGVSKGWLTRREGTTWSTVSVTAAIAILWPSVTGAIARRLGIGRGADLLLYCSVVVMMVGFLMIYVRMRRIRGEMTLLVRQLAIRDAVSTPSDEAAPTPATKGPS